jgi:hypothetical protein
VTDQATAASHGTNPTGRVGLASVQPSDRTSTIHACSDTLTGQVLVQIPRLGHTVQASVLPKQNVAGSNPVSRSKSPNPS